MALPVLLHQTDLPGGSGFTLGGAIPATAAGATLIVYYANSGTAAGVISGITITGGTATRILQSSTGRNLEVWKVTGVTAGATSITVTTTVNPQTGLSIRVKEYSGVLSIPTGAGFITTNSGSTGNPIALPVTPAIGADAIICASARLGGVYSAGPTNGFAAFSSNFWDGTPRDVEATLGVTAPDGVTSYGTDWTAASGNWVSGTFILVGSGSPSLIVTTQPTAKVVDGLVMSNVVVKKTTDGATIDTSFVGNITVSIQSGSGALSGTVTRAAVAGVATFNDLVITLGGSVAVNHSLHATDGTNTINTSVFLVGTDGVFIEASVILDNVPSQGGTDTITLTGGVGSTNLTQSNKPIIHTGTAVAAGDAWMIIGGIYYPISVWDGGGGFTLTGGPTVTAQLFTYKLRRRFQIFIPGTLSQQASPYPFMVCYHGGGERGYDDQLQMTAPGSFAEKVGYNTGSGINSFTTSPFASYNWPALTVFPQSALSAAGTDEVKPLLDAIISYVQANYVIDPLRWYWAGLSFGAYIGHAYVAGRASEFTAAILEAGNTGITDFYFRHYVAGYSAAHPTTGNANTDMDIARTWCVQQFTQNKVKLHTFVGSLDLTPDGGITHPAATMNTSQYNSDVSEFTAAFQAQGMTTGTLTSDYYTVIDQVSFGSTPWDHVNTYTQVNKQASQFTWLFQQSRTAPTPPVGNVTSDSFSYLRRRRI